MRTLLKIVLALRGCRHRWETFHTIKYVNAEDRGRTDGYTYHLRCSRCGAVKQRKLYA